jgi:hypothetical protein
MHLVEVLHPPSQRRMAHLSSPSSYPRWLGGVRVALTNLMERKASAVKYAVKVNNV